MFLILTPCRYPGAFVDETAFKSALASGIKDAGVREVVVFLTQQIGTFLNLDETVNPTNDDDLSSFTMEVSSFLKELGKKKALPTYNCLKRCSCPNLDCC